MYDSFELGGYLAHLRRRWRFAAIVFAVALLSAAAALLVETRRYTARVSLVIDPPSGADPRAATAISPIYLESLRSFEHFASSDHLFAEAVAEFQLRSEVRAGRPLEDLKRKILRVEIPRNTRILEIEVTLTDPAKAHRVATYLAQRAIALNRETGRAMDGELARRAGAEAEQARKQMRDIEEALAKATRQPPTEEALKAGLARLSERQTEMERLALSASLAAAEIENRLDPGGTGEREGFDRGVQKARLQSIGARASRLREEAAQLSSEIAAKQKQWAEREAAINLLRARHKAAQDTLLETEKRVRDIEGAAGYRSERLNLLDPGFVPERPSSPRPLLVFAVALSLAFLFSTVYLSAEYGLRSPRAEALPRLSRVAGRP